MSKKQSWREYRRRQAWELHQKGWGVTQIAEAVGVTKGAVSQWLKAVREQGVEEGLKDHSSPGRPRRISEEQLAQVPEVLSKGAEHYGFVGNRWTARRVAQVLKKELGLEYSVRQTRRLLHEVGYSPQKPQSQAVQRNETAVQDFLIKVVPEVKKK